MSPLSDPAEAVVAGFVSGFVRACMENVHVCYLSMYDFTTPSQITVDR